MRNKLRRKLILSIFSLAATAVCLTSTTYAWFARNENSKVEEFDLNIKSQQSLLLSVDGGHVFYTDVPESIIKKQITGSLSTDPEEINEEYSKLAFTGVTPRQELDASNKPQKVYKENKLVFNKDKIADDNKSHTAVVATPNKDYITFDLWVKMVNTDDDSDLTYQLRLSENTNIISTPQTLELDNYLTTKDGRYGPITVSTEENQVISDKIKVDMKDAMRIAVEVNDNNGNPNGLSVYELSEGLGSDAVEGSTNPSHDKTKNAMYTYYNNIMTKNPLTTAGYGYNTISSTENDLYAFSKESDKVVHLTCYIWLEGWDADFLIGMSTLARTAQINLELGVGKPKEELV